MMLALMYPKVVDRLVVVDTSPLPAKGSHTHSPLLHATAVLKNMEPELRGAQGFSRGLKAEKAIEHVLKAGFIFGHFFGGRSFCDCPN